MSARKKARSRKCTTSPDFDAGLAAFKADVLPLILQSLELYNLDRIELRRELTAAFAGAREHASRQLALLERIADALEANASKLETVRASVDDVYNAINERRS